MAVRRGRDAGPVRMRVFGWAGASQRWFRPRLRTGKENVWVLGLIKNLIYKVIVWAEIVWFPKILETVIF